MPLQLFQESFCAGFLRLKNRASGRATGAEDAGTGQCPVALIHQFVAAREEFPGLIVGPGFSPSVCPRPNNASALSAPEAKLGWFITQGRGSPTVRYRAFVSNPLPDMNLRNEFR